MNRKTVFVDANILYSFTLRNIFMQLAVAKFYKARWTHEVHQEWINALLENRRDIEQSTLESLRDKMNREIPDCLVTDYERLIPTLDLPDIEDRHVLAAAITGKCDIIVTKNLRDFPKPQLVPYGISAVHPDDFFLDYLNNYPTDFCDALKKTRRRSKNPPYTVDEYLNILVNSGLPKTADALRPHRSDF